MKKLTALLLAGVLLLSLASCSSNNSPTESTASPDSTKEYKKTITFGWTQQTTTLDPQAKQQTQHNSLYMLTHETLVSYNEATGNVDPLLATVWDVSEDGLTYTFKLREGVKFSNGETLTADDVVFTYNRAKESAKAATLVALCKFIDNVEAVDANTVKFTLTQKNSGFLITMGDDSCNGILNRKAVETDPEKGPYVGTGRWIVETYNSTDDLVYVRNDNYWGGVLPTEKLVFVLNTDDNSRVINQESGTYDITNLIRAQFWAEFKKYENQDLYIYTPSTTATLWFNTSKEPVNDPYVRLAIAYAINYEDFIIGAFDGAAEHATTNWGKNQFGYFDAWDTVGLSAYEYNLEKAKEYMAKSSHPDGCTITISCGTKSRANQIVLIQNDLKKIGIEVICDQTDSATYSANANAGLCMAGISNNSWNATGEAQRVAYTEGSAENRCQYFSDEITALFDKALAADDLETAADCYKQIQILTHEDCPMIPLIIQYNAVGMVKGVSGIVWSTSGSYDLSKVVIEIQK